MHDIKKYSSVQVSGLNPAEIETNALIKTASELDFIRTNWDSNKKSLEYALEKNRRLWVLLSSSMVEEDCKQPDAIKNNITNLAMYIFQKTVDILVNPQPQSLKILIDINMNIAQGLAGKS